MSLVVQTRISDIIIAFKSLCIDTPLSVDIDLRLTELSLLGGDHDDTVCTSRTVEGIRSRILQDSH